MQKKYGSKLANTRGGSHLLVVATAIVARAAGMANTAVLTQMQAPGKFQAGFQEQGSTTIVRAPLPTISAPPKPACAASTAVQPDRLQPDMLQPPMSRMEAQLTATQDLLQ